VLPGVVLFFAGLAAALGSRWFSQRKGRRAASWLVVVLALSTPYGLAAWWLWELDDDRFPWEALGPAGLVVGFIASYFLFDRQNADSD
jgi:hypothetical protein